MKVFLRHFLLVFFTFLGVTLSAQKLYWVGGTGNFNDKAHWSFESGGQGGAKSPTATDDVYFDENSFPGKSILNFIGQTEVNSIIFSEYTSNVIFSGTQNEKIIIHGDIKLNAYIDNQFDGDIVLNSSGFSTSVFFGLTKIKGNIYFDGNTSWNFIGDVDVNNNSTIYLKSGTLNFPGNRINAGNLIASSGIVINAKSVVYNINNKFNLPGGVIYNDTKTTIYARIKDPSKYQVASNIIFNSASRFHNVNNVSSVCNITQTGSTQPTCSGVCDGTITFHIPAAACSGNDTIIVTWNNAAGNTVLPNAIFTSANTPATYSVDSLCGSSNQYVATFANNLNQDTVYNSPFGTAMGNPSPPKIKNVSIPVFPSCFGKCDGQLSLTVFNSGAFAQTSHWTSSTFTGTVSHGGITSAPAYKDFLNNVCAGTYTVFLTDANGCLSTSQTITVTQPAVMVSTITPVNLLCNGVCNGSITDTEGGGTAPYTFTWTPSGGGAVVSGASPNSTYSNLCAGIPYTVKITDSHGCKDSATTTLSQPTAISFTKNPASGAININCINACSGVANVTGVSGGTPNYSYNWLPATGVPSGGGTSSTYSGLCGSVAGTTYTCTIKDANTCTVSATFTVTAPPALTHTISGTNPKCIAGQGVSTGSIIATEGGGTGPYVFTWNLPPPAGTQTSTVANPNTYTGVSAGTYTVNVVDSKGCKDSVSVTLLPPNAVTGTITTTTNPQCPTLANGQLCVTAGGGAGGFGYVWSPLGGNTACTTPNLTVTPGGTSNYQVTITDANTCTLSVTGTMTSPAQATVTPVITNVKCGSAPCTGSATLNVAGGSGTFTYAWTPAAGATGVISNQCAGSSSTYTVTDVVTNCIYTGTVTFSAAPPTLNLSLSSTTLACNGDCNAVITSTVTGGTGADTYAWSGNGANSVNATSAGQINMCAGGYTCTVTDANLCTQTTTLTIASPPALTVTMVPTQPSCGGACDGCILATPTGGSGSYPGVSWSPVVAPPNTLNPCGLCGLPAPGQTYTLTITDSKGCKGTGNATIITPTSLTVTVNTTPATCSGFCNATATATVGGGAGGYTYSWDGGPFTGADTAFGLCVGGASGNPHSLIVKDVNGCVSSTIFFNVTQPLPISAFVTNQVNTCGPCTGSADGSTSNGGTGPYTYTWTPGNGNASTTSNLCIGNYTLTVGDSHGCPTSSTTFTITHIVSVSLAAGSQSVTCNNANDGSANATASGGTPGYNMVWTTSPGNVTVATCNPASTCTATSLSPGTYVITATDANGCANSDSVIIGNPTLLTLAGSQTNVKCFGTCTGSATVTPAGGTLPYNTINWSDGVTGSPRSNMCPGVYTATIKDSKGCSASVTFTITSSPQLVVTSVVNNPLVCGASNGSIDVTASGGTAAYIFTWTPPLNSGSVTGVSPTSTLSPIPAGIYTVTITDANGCDTTVQIGLSDPGTETVTVATQSVSCFGVHDGSATVTAVGNPPVTMTWPGGPSAIAPAALIVSGDSAATYVVQTVDGNGCKVFNNVVISGPTQIKDSAIIVQPTCASGGSITLNPHGGSGAGYGFTWTPGPGGSPVLNNPAPIDTCVITDGTGCSQTFTYNINPISNPTITLNVTNTKCSNTSDGTANASVAGGNSPYTYTWMSSLGGTFASGTGAISEINLAADVYTLSVTDNGGCTTQQTFTITSPTPVVPNLTSANNLCNNAQSGVCSGTASVSPTGGTPYTIPPNYTYSWPGVAGNPTTQSIASVCPGSYSVIVTDSNNCKTTLPFVIADPPLLSATITSTNPTCFNQCNGTATVTASGGTGTPATYTVTWDNLPQPSTVSNLCGGQQYTVAVIDSNSCTSTQVYTPFNPSSISSITSTVLPKCAGDHNGSITSNTNGGTSPYTYSWVGTLPAGNVIGASPTSTYTNIGAGTYTLYTTDANLCKDSIPFTLAVPAPPGLTYTVQNATCGLNDGSITITSETGTAPLTLQWLNPVSCGSNTVCTNLGAGIDSVRITDGNGCKATYIIAVSNPNGPDVDSVVTNVNCNGSFNASIKDSVVSGNAPYTFAWTPAASPPGTITTTTNTSTFAGIGTGTFICTVTDGAGCQTSTTFVITQPIVISDNGNFTNATCVGINDGSITSIGSGGTPGTTGYSYALDGAGSIGPTLAGHTFSNLPVGTHTVCITDSVGCTKCFTYNINPGIVIASVITSTNSTCFNSCNGASTLSSIGGGTSPYSITWSPGGQTGPIIANLCAGNYVATITDFNGCQATDTAKITAPSAISPNPLLTSPACGLCNGTINVTPTGGTPGTTGYTYTWSNPVGATTSSVNNICAGLYQVTIKDSIGCSQNVSIPVSNPGSPTVTTTATSPICGNACNGVITTTVTGVNVSSPYTYLWLPNGQTSSSINGQCAGDYFVQVKDSVGCITTVADTIKQGVVLISNPTTIVNPTCNMCNGSISVNITGGSGNYSYLWIPTAATTSMIVNACAGVDTVVVTDIASGCKDSIVVLLNSANGPILTATATNPLCADSCNGTANVSILLGTPSYTVNWSTGQTTQAITNICAASSPLSVIVTDAAGCIQTATVTLVEPGKLFASIPIVTQPKCFNDCNGSINTVISGGTPNYTYTWNSASISGSGGNNLCANDYSVTVTDANGCTLTLFDTLNSPTLLSITGTVTPASCNTVPDAAINTTTSGGTPGYAYQWSGGSTATTFSLTNILAGNYSVMVTDLNNCKDSASFAVNANISVTANAGRDTTLCSVPNYVLNGDTTGATSMQWIQLPNPPLNVIATTLSTTVTPTPGSTTQYVLLAQNGTCVNSDTINLTVNTIPVPDAGPALVIFIGQQTTIGGSPTNPGGGTVSWHPNYYINDTTAANPTVNPQATTQYTVYVTNAAGCVGWDTVTVTVLPTFVIPSGFSPNGDGYNEYWQIDYIYMFPNCEVEVYNRWGEQLFYSKGYNTPWAGKYQGKDVPVGTYYYVIRLNDKRFPDHFTGPLTILR